MSKKPSKSPAFDLKPFIAPFRFDGSGTFHLKSLKTDERGGLDKNKASKLLDANRQRLSDFQERLFAQDRWSVLIILQGMDAAGKDSAIKNIFAGVNPQGCEVHSFKQPSVNELDHDFLWRHVVALPRRGNIGIFNRSYYEECLVTRVHRQVLAKGKLPSKLVTKNIWRERFEDICAFERYLARNGTVILKFFLNISKDEQRKRFLDRLDEPGKVWKFSMADVTERALWHRYMAAYQDMLRHTSSAVPWHVVPADHKWFARLVIGSTIVDALEGLNLRFPRADRASLEEFKQVRTALLNEGKRRAVKKVAAKGPAAADRLIRADEAFDISPEKARPPFKL
jgi:PPK2 family polyphosphate:nucleotide phosphotransferase